MHFFNNRSPATIDTEKRYTNFHVDKRLLTCPAVYLKVDRVKKGLENFFTGPFKVLGRFDKYFIIETFKGSSKIFIDRLKPAYTLDFVNDHKTKSKNNNDLAQPSSSYTILPPNDYNFTTSNKLLNCTELHLQKTMPIEGLFKKKKTNKIQLLYQKGKGEEIE